MVDNCDMGHDDRAQRLYYKKLDRTTPDIGRPLKPHAATRHAGRIALLGLSPEFFWSMILSDHDRLPTYSPTKSN